MSWHTLHMKCPNCGAWGGHESVETDPKSWWMGSEMTPVFTKYVGRDISYRKRTRFCSSCQRHFAVAEVPEMFLTALRSEVERQRLDVEFQRREVERLREESERLRS